jgi:hypothetical protein
MLEVLLNPAQGRHKFCVCDTYYFPEDHQRWCHRCDNWYHPHCCQPYHGIPQLSDISGLDVNLIKNDHNILWKVAMAPIERGGSNGPVGHGKAVLNARRMILHTGQPDISRYIGHTMLGLADSTVFTYYLCPHCDRTPI